MKLATFEANGAPELGVVQDGRIVPLDRAAPSLAADMIDLIARWSQVEGEVRAIAGRAADSLALDEVRLLAPIRRPGKIMAIGLNYADHIEESGQQKPEHQVWFAKMSTAVSGPFDPILIPKAPSYVDYEAEMVAVIGVGASAASALQSNAGSLSDARGRCIGSRTAVAVCRRPGRLDIAIVAPSSLIRK